MMFSRVNTDCSLLQEWIGEFWIDASLTSLRLVYQLGYKGFPCVVPDKKVYKMTMFTVLLYPCTYTWPSAGFLTIGRAHPATLPVSGNRLNQLLLGTGFYAMKDY
jgi:hypothetical protein